MNRLPSPFSSDMPTIMTPPNPSSNNSPGFLMLTRPPSASSDHSRSMGRGRGRGRHWSNHSPQDHRGQYSNNSPMGFTPFRNRTPYRGNYNPRQHFQTPSPNTSFTSYRSTPSNQSNLQSTPYSSSKKLFKQEQGHKNTPLKSIPIEKFISAIMMKDPWENVELKSLPEQTSAEDSLDDDEPSLSGSQSTTESPEDGVSDNSDEESD